MTRLPESDFRPLPAAGAVLGGKYRVERELGRGGMGVVFSAHHLVTGKQVAIKWLLSDATDFGTGRKRLVREARTASSLSDPSIVDVYDIVEDGDATFLVMEYLEGESLAARLAYGPMSIPVLLELLLPAMRAVGRAHARGIVHRDLKPDNLFICEQPDGSELLKVLDFGISKFVLPEKEEPSITRSGMTVGSPHYMPMEQLQGLTDIDGRIDVYAFGVILYEALTGQKPFAGASYGEIAIRVATHTPELPRRLRPDIPAMLERAVLGALARDREARYPTMQALISALEVALHPELDVLGVTASAEMPHLPSSPDPAKARSGVRMGQGARSTQERVTDRRSPSSRLFLPVLVLVCLGAVLGWWLWRQGSAAPSLPLRSPSVPSPASPSGPAHGKVEPQVAPEVSPPAKQVERPDTDAKPPHEASRSTPETRDAKRSTRATPVEPVREGATRAPQAEQNTKPSPRRAGPLVPDDF